MDSDGWMFVKIADLETGAISTRAKNALMADGIVTVYEVVLKSEEELLRIPSFGKAFLGQLQAFLEAVGLRHADKQTLRLLATIKDLKDQSEDARAREARLKRQIHWLKIGNEGLEKKINELIEGSDYERLRQLETEVFSLRQMNSTLFEEHDRAWRNKFGNTLAPIAREHGAVVPIGRNPAWSY